MRTRLAFTGHLLLFLALLSAACSESPPPIKTPAPLMCHIGAWRTNDGALVTLLPSTRGALALAVDDGRRGTLRESEHGAFVMRSGRIQEGDDILEVQLPGCGEGPMALRWLLEPQAAAQSASQLPLVVRDAAFVSHGTNLQGRLVLPANGAPWPLVVLTHGSERSAALDNYDWQYALPAEGIAVFVYDKRGTGASGGEYTQDFFLLADDAVAALATAESMAPDMFNSKGFMGGSQGGWISPLAASKHPVDFVVALYGFAESALAEDREEVADELRRKGYGDDVLAKARELTDATGLVMASDFSSGFDELDAVKAKYTAEPWFGEINGEFTGDLLRYPAFMLRAAGPFFDLGTSWEYDPAGILTELTAEQLWVLAEQDTEAPNRETKKRLLRWQAQGRPIDVAVFPNTEHGMWEFIEQDGERVGTRHAFGYAHLLIHWIKRHDLNGKFGAAELHPRAPLSRVTNELVPDDTTLD